MIKINWIFQAMFVISSVAFISCGGGDDDIIDDINGPVIDIDVNNKSNNHNIISIDDKNFYIDYVKYSVKEGHLEVSGYDKDGFKGVANIASKVIYKGNSYEVLGIGSDAFAYCKVLTSIKIPESVTHIGSSAFYGCTGLTSINIPNGVTSIGSRTFMDCSGLTSVNISENDTIISYLAFYGCTSLKSLKIPDSVTIIDEYAFKGCSNLATISLSKNLSTIRSEAFCECESLTTVVIPDNITKIGSGAFYGCKNLSSISIGNKISYISPTVFAECEKLKDIYCYAERIPKLEGYRFMSYYFGIGESGYKSITLHVLNGLIYDYQNTFPWNKFEKIVGLN